MKPWLFDDLVKYVKKERRVSLSRISSKLTRNCINRSDFATSFEVNCEDVASVFATASSSDFCKRWPTIWTALNLKATTSAASFTYSARHGKRVNSTKLIWTVKWSTLTARVIILWWSRCCLKTCVHLVVTLLSSILVWFKNSSLTR